MASQLNIKDPVLIEGAQLLAKRRGKAVTATLRGLVERELANDKAQSAERLARMRKWADEVYEQIPDDVKRMTSKEIMDSLYDDAEPDGFAK